MKNKTIWMIVLIAAVVGIVLSILGFALGGSPNMYFDRKGIHLVDRHAELKNISNLNLEPFSNIDLSIISKNVEVVNSDIYGIEIVDKRPEQIEFEVIDDKLILIEKHVATFFTMNFDWNNDEEKIKIFVPKDKDLNNVEVKLASGNFVMQDKKCNSFKLKMSSGKTTLNQIQGKTLEADVTSGALNIMNGAFENTDLQLTSGNINLDDSKLGVSLMKITSGSIKANNCDVVDLQTRVTSGLIAVNGNITGKIELKVTSGTIKLGINGTSKDYSKAADINSGSVKINNESIVDEYKEIVDSKNSIDFKVTSGNIDINFID